MFIENIIENLPNMSLLDLFRLSESLNDALKDSAKNKFIKDSLQIGQAIKYFDIDVGKFVTATVLEIKTRNVIVENEDDGKHWIIPFYQLELSDIENTQSDNKNVINKQDLKIGQYVYFLDKNNQRTLGQVQKLFPRSVMLTSPKKWQLSYTLLEPVFNEKFDINLYLEKETILV